MLLPTYLSGTTISRLNIPFSYGVSAPPKISLKARLKHKHHIEKPLGSVQPPPHASRSYRALTPLRSRNKSPSSHHRPVLPHHNRDQRQTEPLARLCLKKSKKNPLIFLKFHSSIQLIKHQRPRAQQHAPLQPPLIKVPPRSSYVLAGCPAGFGFASR